LEDAAFSAREPLAGDAPAPDGGLATFNDVFRAELAEIRERHLFPS
jgi:hypothetical protein